MARISVVVSTYQREALLRRVLAHLHGQTCADFEVIVAVDAKQEDVAGVRAVAGAARVVQPDRPGVSAARNAGWRAAGAPLVLFIGDDMLPAPDLVERHLALHTAHPDDEVGGLGHVRWARELERTPFMAWLEEGVQFDFGGIRGTEAAWWHLYACNASLKVAALERVDGFDEAFEWGYEELDLGLRLHERGFRLVYDPAALVEHVHPTTLEDYKARMAIVAAAERRFVAKHPQADAYFHDRFTRAAALPAARDRGARLARVVPRRVPVIGTRVWFSADRWFDQQLAPAFLEAWDAAD
jgi:GT2 family glycosyltransferase